ncbi:uncharacterized protein EKO05_0007390 [Ascochyta rabiei]|uniref:uncharacterized protein n=1 Tax=Didymella rabiei TaxID=5454 RepID=UPI0021FB6A97|nr:uncharacterized protein EKO05_0007390 [Ascochyta rabiei]UPX17013.1 hypothetical protein EKO05_0007390 [Ascochyta rabiei]
MSLSQDSTVVFSVVTDASRTDEGSRRVLLEKTGVWNQRVEHPNRLSSLFSLSRQPWADCRKALRCAQYQGIPTEAS